MSKIMLYAFDEGRQSKRGNELGMMTTSITLSKMPVYQSGEDQFYPQLGVRSILPVNTRPNQK
jgi:hypothetical protein